MSCKNHEILNNFRQEHFQNPAVVKMALAEEVEPEKASSRFVLQVLVHPNIRIKPKALFGYSYQGMRIRYQQTFEAKVRKGYSFSPYEQIASGA